MSNRCVFEVGCLISPKIAKVNVAIVSKDDSNFAYANHMMLLPFDLAMRHLHQHSRLKSAVLGVPSMQVESFIVVNRMHLSHNQISFLHYLSHIKLILLVLFSLLRNVCRIQRQKCICWCSDIYLPSFVCYLNQKDYTSCTLPTTMSPTWGEYLLRRGFTIISLFVI